VLRDVKSWRIYVRAIPVERKRKDNVNVKSDDEGKKEERKRFRMKIRT
jgi:hypothetical protein